MQATSRALYRRQVVVSLLCCSFVIFATVAAYSFGLMQAADNYLYDLGMSLRGPQQTSGRISLVLMDEESARQLQRERGQWSRSKLAQALDNLCGAGAEVIGLDMVMSAPDQDPEEDRTLAAAIERCNNVVLARVSSAQGVREITALASFREVMIGDGFIDVPLDKDGVLRKIRFLNAKPEPDGSLSLLPSFALEVARVYFNLEYRFDFSGDDYFLLGTREKHLRLPYPELLINYSGSYNAFDIISFSDATSNRFDPALVKGRIILVGSTLSSEKDFFTTPISRFRLEASTLAGRFGDMEMGVQGSDEPGVACHAYAVDNILGQKFLRHLTGRPIAWLCLAAGAAGLVFSLLRLGWVYEFAILFAGLATITVIAYLSLSRWHLRIDIFPLLLVLNLQFITGVVLQKVFERKQTAMITSMFGKYVSARVVNELIKGDISTTLEGRKADLTILFSDLRGFTTLSERLGARDTAILLNTYFNAMIPLVFTHGGTLDKLMGDAIMAFFGAPVDLAGHPVQGATTALDMIGRLKQLKMRSDIAGLTDLEIGIGLNTGEVTVGNLGSSDFMNYTIIGDAVNLASRLEGLNKTYGTAIIVSDFLASRLDDRFLLRDLDIVRVKGKKTAVTIYELIGWSQDVSADSRAALAVFATGLNAYRRQEWETAARLFHEVLESLPTDGPSRLYLERIERMRAAPPGPDWDGVSAFEHK